MKSGLSRSFASTRIIPSLRNPSPVLGLLNQSFQGRPDFSYQVRGRTSIGGVFNAIVVTVARRLADVCGAIQIVSVSVTIQASVANWNRHIAMLDAHFRHGGQFITGEFFTLADVVLGLSTHRWLHSPIERPPLDAVHGYYQRLSVRPAFRAHVDPHVP